MQSAIDFRELRRQERHRLRSSKQKSNTSSIEDCASNVGNSTKNESSPNPSTCTEVVSSVDPYDTMLPQNQLSEDTNRIRSSTNDINSVFYARDFLAQTQTQDITSWLTSIPDYTQNNDRDATKMKQNEREESIRHNGKWTRLKYARRKVALFDGTISSLPPILQRLSNTLVAVGAFPSSKPPNHVLINEYQPGEGIMPHTDGPAYESRTGTISLGGSDVIFKLWPRQQHDDSTQLQSTSSEIIEKIPSLELILHGEGSLVLFSNDAYLDHCHEISEDTLEEITSSDGVCGNDIKGGSLVKRGYRVSLTFRTKK